MKKICISFAAIALAATSFVSCNKTEIELKEDGPKTVNFTVTGKVDPKLTKTYIEENAGTYLAHWSDVADEHLGLVFDDIVDNMEATTLDAFDITADVATFAGSATISVDDHTIHPFYPASAFNKTYGSTGKIGLTLAGIQHPVTDSFDPAADVMIGADQNITVDDADNVLIENVVLHRPMAVLRLHLVAKNDQAKAYGETVTSVVMTVAEGKTLTGNFAYTPNNSAITWNTKNNSVSAVYDALYNNADQVLIDTDGDYNSVYLVINPETLAEGSSIVFNIETDVHSGINKISRTITVPAGGMEFLAGRVNEINLTIRDKDVPDVVVDNRIIVEGFDNVSTSKTQADASTTGVSGTGVSNSLAYTYSSTNTNIRFNSNGQSDTNPYLYLSLANDYLIMANIVVDNQTYLDFSAKVKNSATFTLQYKESSSDTWLTAGSYSSTSSFSDARLKFLISNTVESLDLKLIGSAAMIIDDIVLEPGTAPTALTMSDISVSSRTEDSITFSWDAVDDAVGYQVSTNGGSTYGSTQVGTTFTWDELSSFANNTINVKAIADGVNHLNSEPKSLTAKTTLALPSSITWASGTKTVSWTDNNTGAGEYGSVYKYQYTIDNGESFTDIDSPGTSVVLDIATTKTFKIKAVCIADATYNSALSSGTLCNFGLAAVYTADFEGNSEHRTSGTNSYTAGPREYTVGGVVLSLAYADAVTTGTKLDGSTSQILARIAKKTTNSPTVTSANILSTTKTIKKISYISESSTSMPSDVSLSLEYSTDGTSWTSLSPSADSDYYTTYGWSATVPDVKTNTFYFRFTVSTSSSDNNNNRDVRLDKITVYGE